LLRIAVSLATFSRLVETGAEKWFAHSISPRATESVVCTTAKQPAVEGAARMRMGHTGLIPLPAIYLEMLPKQRFS
jgi:hypothetical protein